MTVRMAKFIVYIILILYVSYLISMLFVGGSLAGKIEDQIRKRQIKVDRIIKGERRRSL